MFETDPMVKDVKNSYNRIFKHRQKLREQKRYNLKIENTSSVLIGRLTTSAQRSSPGGSTPYISYIGMCRPKGYGFQAVLV